MKHSRKVVKNSTIIKYDVCAVYMRCVYLTVEFSSLIEFFKLAALWKKNFNKHFYIFKIFI